MDTSTPSIRAGDSVPGSSRVQRSGRGSSVSRSSTPFRLRATKGRDGSSRESGLRELRRYYRMLIELDAPPPAPEWPEGLEVDTFDLEDAKAFHDTMTEAFEDEWNFVAMTFEEWREMRIVKDPDFDPTLWFIVRDGDEVAAMMRNEPDRSGAGFVGAIGVRKPWRRRGIALALLRHAFGEFYRRGKRSVALGVDAENPTGATRLYERAGMRIAYEAVAFGKDVA